MITFGDKMITIPGLMLKLGFSLPFTDIHGHQQTSTDINICDLGGHIIRKTLKDLETEDEYTRTYVLNVTSQMWLNDSIMDRPIWWHYAVLIVPKVKLISTLYTFCTIPY